MEGYSIVIMPPAQLDALDIVDHLNTLTPEAAVSYYDLFVEKITMLSTTPEMCAPVRDTQLRLREYRALIIDDYIIFYVFKGKTVELRRILYAKRHYDQL